MANDLYTVSDFVADAMDVDDGMISEVVNQAPIVSRLPMTDTSTGKETHKFNKYTGEPTVGFRSANSGRDYDHSEDTIVTVTCVILDFSWRVDFAVANAWRRGPEDLIRREGARHLGAALAKVETQLFYGTTALGDASGFSGLIEDSDLDALADDMVINAGGTTASVQSSLWAMKTGDNGVKMVTPFASGITLGDTIVTEANDANYPVYYTPASMYIGAQLAGKYDKGRICNINDPTDSKPLTDDLVGDLLAEFKLGAPTLMAANAATINSLRKQRTATNPTGAPAPPVESVFGIPLIQTERVVQTEAVEV